MNLNEYVVVIIVGICFCVGYVIKHSFVHLPNRFIPCIMAVLGVVLNIWIQEWSVTPEIILGGMVSGLASTGTFEALKQVGLCDKKKPDDSSKLDKE